MRYLRYVSTGFLIAAQLSPMLVHEASGDDSGSWCTRTTNVDPQNIVLFVLDDTSAVALPMFSPPIQWPDVNNPIEDGAAATTDLMKETLRREAAKVRPDQNLFAARALAGSSLPDGDSTQLGNRDASNSDSGLAVPLDLKTASSADAAHFRYVVGNSATIPTRSTDVVAGFGALRRLGAGGVVFPRFYATSGVCSPTRASIMTGRHPVAVGVPENRQDLDESAVIWAGFLHQMCTDHDASGNPIAETPCYHTGLIGKWHLGDKAKSQRFALWTRGFDEAIYDTQNAREHWFMSPFQCSPQTDNPQPAVSTDPNVPTPGFYCTDEKHVSHVTCRSTAECDVAPFCLNGGCDCGGYPVDKNGIIGFQQLRVTRICIFTACVRTTTTLMEAVTRPTRSVSAGARISARCRTVRSATRMMSATHSVAPLKVTTTARAPSRGDMLSVGNFARSRVQPPSKRRNCSVQITGLRVTIVTRASQRLAACTTCGMNETSRRTLSCDTATGKV
jgi:Sulfatase